MDHSYSENDVSLSPSQVLEKLEMLRQLQMMQRGKLLKQRLDYQNSPEISSSITEIVSHFSNSTTYNTFRSLLQSSQDSSEEVNPCDNLKEITSKNSKNPLDRSQNLQNAIDGVSVLNLSQESEFIPNSPISIQSRSSNPPRIRDSNENFNNKEEIMTLHKKQISLDEMPILSPKKNFEELIVDKLKNHHSESIPNHKLAIKETKPFLRRGEGMARFGLHKNDLIIQNTKSLPWRKKSDSNQLHIPSKDIKQKSNNKGEKIRVQILTPEYNTKIPPAIQSKKPQDKMKINDTGEKIVDNQDNQELYYNNKIIENTSDCCNSSCNLQSNNINKLNLKVNSQREVHPTLSNKGKTWAAVLTKEQDDFLRQLKQSDYYKNFSSPTKSLDTSCCESISKVTHFKEIAEQNLFDLIESKVSHESFNIENSFFNKFLRKSKFECSGESTPLVMQKCLAENPDLRHIAPVHKRNEISYSEDDTCMSQCTDCSECCSVSTSCSCQTQVSEHQKCKGENKMTFQQNNQDINKKTKSECHNDNVKAPDTNVVNANMAEMNAKLIATSELLKERLRELEDEIETFRKENANISKLREEINIERQKFYEEKSAFEQKFNEEKILSEYYLAEEKEKLSKQKQMYERYVRDIRGRLTKKDKDEVTNLKKEVCDLREEIRVKDAKSTTSIARLRNQLKLLEKDKKALECEVEKLIKENKRIQHSNEVTRRLTNIKYLEQINKKLSNMTSRETKSEIDLEPNIKYKAFEIERQSRLKKTKGMRTRAKSVPNLNVTSKYAKYFSQKDSLSDKGKNSLVKTHIYASKNDIDNESIENLNDSTNIDQIMSENEDNYLEKIYNERFRSNSPSSKRSSGISLSDSPSYQETNQDTNNFFLQKSNSVSSNKKSLSPHHPTPNSSYSNISKSPSILSEKSHHTYNLQTTVIKDHRSQSQYNKSKSSSSILSNHSSSSQKPITVIYKDSVYNDDRMMPSPEPTSSSTSITKTSLNPVESIKPNGDRELRFPNGNVKIISADGKYSKFIYYNGDVKENFYDEGRVKYFYAESKTYHTTHPDGLEVLEFPDGQVEKRYKDGSSEIRLPNGMMRYYDPKNDLVREDWRYPDGTALTVSANGEQRITFPNGQIEVHAKDHKRREFPDGTMKLVYNDGTSETRYASGRIRIKDKHGNLIMDSASRNIHNLQ